MSRLVLTVPMPPNIANGSHGHWRGKYAAKKAYWRALDARLIAGLIPRPPIPAWPGKVRIASTMHLGARMDVDNAMRRHKWVIDWMKGAYIKDDGPKHLEWAGFPEQVVKRGQDYRIVLTLEAA